MGTKQDVTTGGDIVEMIDDLHGQICRKSRGISPSVDRSKMICVSRDAYRGMLAALKSIALIGGNLPDDRLTNATGPNDAELRGGMYVSAREIARAAITKATESE